MAQKIRLGWISKIGIGLVLLSVIVLVYFITVWIISLRKIEMPIVLYTYYDYNQALQTLNKDYEPVYSFSSNQELKSLIEQESGIKFYLYREKDIKGNDGGLSFPPIRTIVVDEELEGYAYCRVFAHEVMHIQKCSIQENYIEFATFKFLYESKNEELHNFGVWYGIQELLGCNNFSHNICGNIINYLTKN